MSPQGHRPGPDSRTLPGPAVSRRLLCPRLQSQTRPPARAPQLPQPPASGETGVLEDWENWEFWEFWEDWEDWENWKLWEQWESPSSPIPPISFPKLPKTTKIPNLPITPNPPKIPKSPIIPNPPKTPINSHPLSFPHQYPSFLLRYSRLARLISSLIPPFSRKSRLAFSISLTSKYSS